MTDEEKKQQDRAVEDPEADGSAKRETPPGAAGTEPAGEENQAAMAPGAEPTVEGPSASDTPQAAAAGRRRWSLTGLLGLLLAIGAIGASAYVWWQMQQEETQRGRQFAQIHEQIGHVDDGLQALGSRVDALASDSRQRDQQLSERLQALSALGPRLAAAEQAITSLSGTSVSARQAWLEAEAEYLMQVANSRLHLAQDFQTSIAAMKAADERLRALDRPDLFEVRGQLAAEIQALEAVRQPDIEGIALKLGALAAGVHRFPLRNTLPTREDDAQTAPEDQPAGWTRAKSVMGSALKSMVSIRRTDEEVVPLISAEDEFLLRRNLELQLLSARLAALKGDHANYVESLRMSKRWLNDYFETETAAVARAVERVGELEAEDIEVSLPDISGSLKLLRERTGPGE